MICLHSIDPTTNRFRWYSLQLQPRLFGGVDLIRRWGRLGQTGGTERIDHLPDQSTAALHIHRTLRVRERHGYVRVA